MAQRCQYTGNHPETFWRRNLEAIEEACFQTGYQPIKIKRGGGAKKEATTYQEFLIAAANWVMNAARTGKESGRFKSYNIGVFELIPEALKMIPRVRTGEKQERTKMQLTDEEYIQRADKQSLNYGAKALERAAESGRDIDKLATGEVIALDVDPAKGGDDSLRALITEHGPLDETLTTLTGGGGFHAFLKPPSGLKIKNSVSRIGRGIDIRGKGGFAIIASSLHESGKRYRVKDAPIADAQEWLIIRLTEEKQAVSSHRPEKRSHRTQAAQQSRV